MIVDVSAAIGAYPFRQLPWSDPDTLVAEMNRTGIDMAWAGYLPSMLHNDARPGNLNLLRLLYPHRDRLAPVPTVHPDQPRWEEDVELALHASAPAVRAFPMHVGIDPCGSQMRGLCAFAGRHGMAVQLIVRFEDVRQRVPADTTPDLPAAAVRQLARLDPPVRLLISNAGREFIEEVHFGLTDAEASRVLWDIGWLWGPPADDIPRLIETVGAERFVFGSLMPLRIPEAPIARLDLAGLDEARRGAIEYGNLTAWQSRDR